MPSACGAGCGRCCPSAAAFSSSTAPAFPNRGPASVGVARQYCGALGKIANCQVAVTAALWTGVRAWCLGAALYLPEEWLTPRRAAAGAHSGRGPLSGEMAVGAAPAAASARGGLTLTAVLADAEFGDVTAFRAALHRLRLPYAVGISSHLTVFATRPRLVRPAANRRGRPRTRLRMVTTGRRRSPSATWSRSGRGRRGDASLGATGRSRHARARFTAVRVTPAHEWRHGRLAPEIWLLVRRGGRAQTPRLKYYFVHLPATASLRALVALGPSALGDRAAISGTQKRTWASITSKDARYPGWQHHVVLTAVAHAYIQRERMRRGAAGLTFPAVRAIVQEIFTALLFAAKPRYMHWMEQAKRKLQLRI